MRDTIVEINIQALQHNFVEVKRRVRQAFIMPIVKANAYGHGIVGCSKIFQNMGADILGVAFPEEAGILRRAGLTMPILALVPPFAHEAEDFCSLQVQFMACSLDVVRAFATEAQKQNIQLKAHLYIDTGMRRDGIAPEEALAFMEACKAYPQIQFEGICTHFATSDAASKDFLLEQLHLFQQSLEQLHQAGFSFRYTPCSQ